MSRSGKKRSGKLALRISFIAFGVAFVACAIVLAITISQMGKALSADQADEVSGKAWGVGLALCAVVAAVVAVVIYTQAAALGTRVTDLALAVAKIGRRGADVRIRNQGNDEITALGRAVQYLASDTQSLLEGQGEDGGAPVTVDPQVRELRDRVQPEYLAELDGFELDGALEAGSRGGLDYFDSCEFEEGGGVVFLVSGEGVGPMAVFTARTARDELVRAFKQGATPRKALAHTNRVLHKILPRGACAKATVLQLGGEEAKLYQAGARAPLWICSGGEVSELSADGIALGLDEGPVFEKGLRPEKVPMPPGLRLVLTNEAGVRLQELLDLVAEHSPKHTAPFMNMVLGGLVDEVGGELREDVVLITAKRSG